MQSKTAIWQKAALCALPFVTALLVACKPSEVKTAQTESLPAEVLFAGQMCAVQTDRPALQWVASQEEWARWQSASPRKIIGLDDTGAAVKPRVDFSREAVVVVGIGQKSTGGYAVSLRDPGAQVEDEVLTVHVRTEAPAKDAFVTQVITSPCVAVKVPRVQVKQLRAIDQTGEVLAQAPAP